MACEAGYPQNSNNLKFRMDSNKSTGKHEKKAATRVRQMTLTMTPKKNEFERELATALLMENIPLAKVEGKFLKPFIEK